MKCPQVLSCFAPHTPRLAIVIIIGLTLLTLSACGKKGPVRPKLETLPGAPEQVTLQQQGKLFLLCWSIPAADQDSSANNLAGYNIKRLDYDGAEGCPTCRDPQLVIAEIDIRYPDPAQRIGNRLYWRDLDIRPGSGYRYAIVPLTSGGIEAPATTIHLTVQQPPPSPKALQVEAGDGEVKVQWTAPALPAGMELVGYNLYRRQAKYSFPIVPVNAEPLEITKLLDRGLDNGRAYEYRVSVLVKTGDQVIESMASPAALITPQEGR